MSKNRDKKHSAHKADAAAHAQEVIESTAGDHEQHLVEVPKGTSKAKFLFNFLLVVFLLLIFSITGPMMTSLSGNTNPNADKAYLTWTTPDGTPRSFTYEQFRDHKRAISYLDPLRQGLFLGNGDSREDIFAARFLIMEQLAERAGIQITDQELSESIKSFFGGAENYTGWIASMRGVTPKTFEKVLRRGLAVRRYALTDYMVASEVLSEDIVDAWLEDAKEFNFEFAVATATDFEDAARAELPDDEVLEDYFTAMPPFEKTRFNTERSMSATLAWYDPAAESDYSTLLTRFPAEGEETPEQVAERYYTSFSHVRFLREVPETDEERKAAEAAGDDRYFLFEEVKDQALVEAPIYYAMVEWLRELEYRSASGEEFNFETEAQNVGLTFSTIIPRTRDNWVDAQEPWAGRYLWSALTAGKEGEFVPRVAVEEGALVVANITQILPPELPPFAEIRDDVADKWVQGKTPELATAKLEAIRDAFGTRPEGDALFETTATSEDFRAAVEAAGLTVAERGWGRQSPQPGSDLTGDAEFYIRSKATLFVQPADTVLAAEAENSKRHSYLMRCVGERAGDPATMTPAEASRYKDQAVQTRAMEVFTTTIGNDDWFRSKFNVDLVSERDEEEEG